MGGVGNVSDAGSDYSGVKLNIIIYLRAVPTTHVTSVHYVVGTVPYLNHSI